MSVIYYGIYFFIFVIVNAQNDSCKGYNDFECGRRSVPGKEVIANGTNANAKNWPWFANVLARDKHNNYKIIKKCDGSIISRTAVLTNILTLIELTIKLAGTDFKIVKTVICTEIDEIETKELLKGASCVHMDEKRIATKKFLVQAGTSKYIELGTFNEIGRQILPVEGIVVHPGFKIPKEPSFDLAILLVNKLVFTEYVQPICVWGPLYDKTELFGQQAVIATFTSYDPDSMQVSNAVVQSDDTCVAYTSAFEDDLNEFNFCYGYLSDTNRVKRSRRGSGLALAVTHDDNVSVTWYLHGVASRCVAKPGDGGCDPKKLSLFTYVAPHFAWIHLHAFSN